jgi:hypothetical protein
MKQNRTGRLAADKLPAKQSKFGKKPDIKDTRGSAETSIDYIRFLESLYRK